MRKIRFQDGPEEAALASNLNAMERKRGEAAQVRKIPTPLSLAYLAFPFSYFGPIPSVTSGSQKIEKRCSLDTRFNIFFVFQEMPVNSVITHPEENTLVKPGQVLEISGIQRSQFLI